MRQSRSERLISDISDPVVDWMKMLLYELAVTVMDEPFTRLQISDVESFNARARQVIPLALTSAFDEPIALFSPLAVDELQETFDEYMCDLSAERIVVHFDAETGWLVIDLFACRLAAALRDELGIETSGIIHFAFGDETDEITMPALPRKIEQLERYAAIIAKLWQQPLARATLWASAVSK